MSLTVVPNAVTGDARPEQQDKAGDLVRRHRWFRAYETNKRREMEESRSARQYYHDKQWTDVEIERLRKRGQQPTVRNRIKRKVDFLVGVEQRLRRDPKAYPRTPKHEQDADVATAGLRFACDLSRWEKVSSDCMHDGLVSGIGAIFIGIADQDPRLKTVPVDRFFYDPRAVLSDFSDARYLGLHLWFDVDEAKERWPDHRDRLAGMLDANNVQMTGFISEQDRAIQWADFENRRVRIVEFWELRSLNEMGKPGFGWYYTYFTGELVLEEGWSPYTGENGVPDCPYEAWSPYVDERGDRYGMVRTMKSVQDEINYSASKLLHRIATDRFFYEEGSIEDVDELGRQLARPDGKIRIMKGEWGKSVGIVDQALKIQGEGERYNLAVQEIENLGPNPGLVGHGEGVDGASGRALLAQRDSGMTELSPVFERHRDWKLRVYRKLWQRCRQAWTAERWIRITDDDRAVQFVGINQYGQLPDGTITAQNVVAEMDMDIILNEGPDTITMNEELMQTLSSIGDAAVGPLGKVLIELSNTPNKERLLKMLDQANAPSPEVAEMQKRMAHLEEMLQAITIDEKRAAIENKRADTLAKLTTAMQPQQQQTDEFGNPIGAPPAHPAEGLMTGLQALSMFPLHYGEPLLEETAETIGGPAQGEPDGDEAMGAGQPPQGGPPMPAMPPGMPPPGVVPPPVQMPEQMAQAGALPVNPMA